MRVIVAISPLIGRNYTLYNSMRSGNFGKRLKQAVRLRAGCMERVGEKRQAIVANRPKYKRTN
jgi:hypothetical protein